MAKKYDMAVKTGEYQSNGETKARYSNVGAVMDGKDGGFFAAIDPHMMLGICHAAISKGQDRLVVSMFAPRENGQQAPQQKKRPDEQVYGGGDEFSDEVPF